MTGDAREDGNGYTNIKLTGTIRQIVANAPDVGTAAIEMVSGTADISYANGAITITSNGGVIKNIRLFAGAYAAKNTPQYQPKGYGAELLECLRYCYKNKIRRSAKNAWSLTDQLFYFPVPMRTNNPTVLLIEPDTGWVGYASMWHNGEQRNNIEVTVNEVSSVYAWIGSASGKFEDGADMYVIVEAYADL